MNLNKVFVLGNLTRDPERKNLPSGQAVANFGVATNRFYTSRDGEKQQEVEFHNIVAFGKLADTISQYLNKGSLVLIEGRLRTRNWQDATGQKHYRTEIITERMQLGPRFAAKFTPESQPTPPAAPQGGSEFSERQPQIKQIVRDEEIPVIEEDAPQKELLSEEESPKENPGARENPGNKTFQNDDEEIDVDKIPF